MFSFLVMITRSGIIDQTIWSEPDYILSSCNHSLFELFTSEGKELIFKAIKKSTLDDDAFVCETSVKLLIQPSSITLCVLPMDQLFLVFATEDKLAGKGTRSKGYLDVVHKFMDTIKGYADGRAITGNAAPNTQVEIIQTLTNELRSRRRLLEETNTQMNIINQDLNNRLVKDALTGLVSRYQYRTEIEFSIAQNPGKLGIFVFMDIDNFKAVNDNYGHAAGDQYLVEFSERLKSLPIENITKMRISGDEFGLFVFGLDDTRAPKMESLWRKIKDYVLSRPIEINGNKLPITVSAGMSVYGLDTFDIYELIENADFAMYSSKRRGKNRYSVFDKNELNRLNGMRITG
jgi:diguanylate cyclase (GGDEF)-like protein